MDDKIIEEALQYAIEDVKKIAEREPYENFPHERQIQCFLYDYFKHKNNFFVHPEAGYQKNNRKKGDLRVMQDGEEYWIEIKVASYGGKGCNNKPEEWQADINKLNGLTEKGTKIFILIGLFPNGLPKENSNFMKFIKKYGDFIETKKLSQFTWKNDNIVPKVWIRQWE